MRRTPPVLAAAAALVAGAVLSLRAADSPASVSAAVVKRAGGEYGAYLEKHDVGLRLRHGLPLEELPDLTREGARRDARFGAELLSRLSSVKEPELSDDDTISLGVLRFAARNLSEAERFYGATVPVTPYASPLRTVHQALSQQPLKTPDERARYLALLDTYARWIRDIEGVLREEAKRGVVAAAPEIPLMVPPFRAALDLPKGPLHVDPSRLASLSDAERAAFDRAESDALATRVVPAVSSLVSYVEGEYATKAPAGVGVSQYPGGPACYRFLVRTQTTLDLAPEEIHRIGLAEGERLDRELDAVRRKVGFEGTLAEFRKHLRTDPRFFAKDADEIGARLEAAHRRIEPLVSRWFGTVPKAPGGVARLPAALEGAMTFGYYDPPNPREARGLYYYNGSKPNERSTLMAAALIYHELVPGHHFQLSLQQEAAGLPMFRREFWPTAFVEGWGEYASDVASEMGLYDDPYDRAGRLMMASFLASRLVVDTGMNALGWPLEKARAYMTEHTLQSPAEIETETLRYSCDIPGQALAYSLGARKLHELRDKAEHALGAGFDPRRFHDALLLHGSMPLPVLEAHVGRFIAEEKERLLRK